MIIWSESSLAAVLNVFHLFLQISLYPSHLFCVLGGWLVLGIALTRLFASRGFWLHLARATGGRSEGGGEREESIYSPSSLSTRWLWLGYFHVQRTLLVSFQWCFLCNEAPWLVVIIPLAPLGIGVCRGLLLVIGFLQAFVNSLFKNSLQLLHFWVCHLYLAETETVAYPVSVLPLVFPNSTQIFLWGHTPSILSNWMICVGLISLPICRGDLKEQTPLFPFCRWNW